MNGQGLTIQEIMKQDEVGDWLKFGELWDGDGDGEEFWESGAIAVYDNFGDYAIVDFAHIDSADTALMDRTIAITDIWY